MSLRLILSRGIYAPYEVIPAMTLILSLPLMRGCFVCQDSVITKKKQVNFCFYFYWLALIPVTTNKMVSHILLCVNGKYGRAMYLHTFVELHYDLWCRKGVSDMLGKRLTKLFEPIKIGNLELKNRIKLPAMGIALSDDGTVCEQTRACYAERAKGSVAIIGISCAASKLLKGPLYGIYDDHFIPGLKGLVDIIHNNGAKVYAQVGVGYSFAFGDGPVQYISPSGITPTGKPGMAFRLGGPYEAVMPKALTVDEIRQVVEAFGDGALRARKAGFDAVEVIASVSYMVSQFLSPITNQRTDKYGGSLENRMRFLLEIVEDIQKKAGKDFPITSRVSGADLMEPKGYDLEDTKKMARMLEEAGVAEIDVMSGWHYANVPIIQTWVPQGAWVHFAEGLKKAVKIPVAAGTQIQDVVVAERVIAEGKADMVYMARAIVADPEMPNKAREGRLKDIRPCINCCRCISAVDSPPVYCSVNARMGREAEYTQEKPAEKSKRVLVVGGGPAGMEAARIAAIRGHNVTICEQGSRLGGAMLLASITNRRIEPVLKYMKREIKKLPIEVKTNTRVTAELVRRIKPDAVVLALGGAPAPLNAPGSDSKIVLDRGDVQAIFSGHAVKRGGISRRLISYPASLLVKFFYEPSALRWLLKFGFPFGKRVIVVGGNFAGIELAETLVDRGKKVTVVEEGKRLGADIEITHRWVFLGKLRKAGTEMLREAKLTRITDKGVEVNHSGKTDFFEADTLVKVGITPNTEIARKLEGQVSELYLAGDGVEPGKLMEAMASGFLIGQKI
jgi:2,4-dienoyl-CoA reductase (NADPH2)